jgi:hypothetical protein
MDFKSLKSAKKVSQSEDKSSSLLSDSMSSAVGFLPQVSTPKHIQGYVEQGQERAIDGTTGMLTGGLGESDDAEEEEETVTDEDGNPVPLPKTNVPSCIEGHWNDFAMDKPAAFTRFERIKAVLPSLGLLISVTLVAAALASFARPEPLTWLDDAVAPWQQAPFGDVIVTGTQLCPDSHPIRLTPGGVKLPHTFIRAPILASGKPEPKGEFRLTHFFDRVFCARAGDFAPAVGRVRVDPATSACDAGFLKCGSSCYKGATQCPVTSVALEVAAPGETGTFEFHGKKWILRVRRDADAERLAGLVVAAGEPEHPADPTSFPRLCPGARVTDDMHLSCPFITRQRFGYDDTWRGVIRYDSQTEPDLDAVAHDNFFPKHKSFDEQSEDQRVALLQRSELVIANAATCTLSYAELAERPHEINDALEKSLTAAAGVVAAAFVVYSLLSAYLVYVRASAVPVRVRGHKMLFPLRVVGAIICAAAAAVVFAAVGAAYKARSDTISYGELGCFAGAPLSWTEGLGTELLKPLGLLIAAALVPLFITGYYIVLTVMSRKAMSEF